MTTLIVDNYDSFTWNLVQLVGSLGGMPRVVRNDALDEAVLLKLAPSRVVLSPGPGHPSDPRRIGISSSVLRCLAPLGIPVLGVCLGHQAIVTAFGGRVVRGTPVHGKVATVLHDGDDMFQHVPRRFEAMRYHSLVADPEAIPRELVVTARTEDGIIMAVRHVALPSFGVQFHPESIGTPHGRELVETFLRVPPGVT